MNREALESQADSHFRHLRTELKKHGRDEAFKEHRTLIQCCDEEQLRQHVLQMEAAQFKARIVCGCWHAGTESDAMWKIYGQQLGVMMVSTVGPLKKSLRGTYSKIACAPNPQKYTIAPVKYISGKERRLGEFYDANPWFLKRKAFAHEKEVRLAHRIAEIAGPQDGGIHIAVDPQIMIKGLVLSPFVPEWVALSVQDALLAIMQPSNLKIPITVSTHMRNPYPPRAVENNLMLRRAIESMRRG